MFINRIPLIEKSTSIALVCALCLLSGCKSTPRSVGKGETSDVPGVDPDTVTFEPAMPEDYYEHHQNIGNCDGTIGAGDDAVKYSLSARKSVAAEYRMEQRRKDPVFRAIEADVYKVAEEYDYDFGAAYNRKVKYRDANVKKAVCNGYADAVVDLLKDNQYVAKVEKWSSATHAWNVIDLKDGRKIYCDATWYDSNTVDADGYVNHVPVRNPVDLTFDEAEFNSLGGAANTATGNLLAVHFGWKDCKYSGGVRTDAKIDANTKYLIPWVDEYKCRSATCTQDGSYYYSSIQLWWYYPASSTHSDGCVNILCSKTKSDAKVKELLALINDFCKNRESNDGLYDDLFDQINAWCSTNGYTIAEGKEISSSEYDKHSKSKYKSFYKEFFIKMKK